LVGANGSGKSSLVRLLDGLRLPSSGEVRVAGLPTSGPAGRRAARALVGLVFQSPVDQIVASSVEEDVAFGPENLGLPRPEIRRRVDAALAAVGLEAKARASSHFLSSGQQQRLAVAGALATDARCLAFDEATAMLDPEARGMVLSLMDELVAAGKTVIHVTHDMDEASRASRILLLDAGALVFDGSPKELFEVAAHSQEDRLRAIGLPPCVELAIELGLEPRSRESPAELASRIAAAIREGSLLGSGAAPERRDIPPPRRAALAPSASAVAPAAFSLSGLGHSYLRGTSGETPSLSGVNLDIPEGLAVAFVGRTGSGKSTALQILDGLVSPSEGRVLAFGLDLSDAAVDLRAVRMRSPLAVQRPESALFERYAADDVAFGPRNLGLKGKALVERVRRSMEEAGLGYEAFRDRPTLSLSGGEKRRLALAGVLAMDGDALLLDEPSSALDPPAKRAILGLALGRAASGTTVVMATHSMEEAAAADLAAVFDGGRLVALGDPETLFYDRYDEAWGIGRPFAVALALALEAEGLPLRPRPLVQGELAPSIRAAAEGLPS
jgi:energy-coupling factor transport system ATP-binding protein